MSSDYFKKIEYNSSISLCDSTLDKMKHPLRQGCTVKYVSKNKYLMMFRETQINTMKHIYISWNMFMSQSFYESESKESMNLSVLVKL